MIKFLIKDSSIYGFAEFIFRGLNYFTLPLFALCFNVEEFGLLSLSLVGIQFCAVLFNLGGITAGVGRYFWQENSKLLISTGLYTSIGVSVGASLLLLLMEHYLSIEMFRAFTLLIVLNGFFSAIYNYALQVFRLQFTPWKFALHSLFLNLITLVLRLYAVYTLQKGVEGYLISSLAALLLALPFLIFSIRKELGLFFNWPLARSILHFSYPLFFISMAHWLCGAIDRMMLFEMSSLLELGYYSVGFKLMTVIQMAIIAFNQAWHPHATRSFDEQREQFPLLFKKMMTLWVFFLVFSGGGLALFSTEILLIAFPSNYLPAQECCVILSGAMIFWGTAQMSSLPISMHKKNHLHLLSAWLVASLNFGLNYWLIPIYGATGAAFATAFTYLFLTLFYHLLCERIESIPLEWPKLLFCFFFLTLFTAVALVLQRFPWEISHFLIKGLIFSSFIGGSYLVIYRVLPQSSATC